MKLINSLLTKVKALLANLFSFKSKNKTDELDRKLVFNLNKKGIPTYSQFKTLPKFLSKKEKGIMKYLTIAITICLILLLGDFYFKHTTLVPDVGGSYTEGLVGIPQYVNPVLASYNDVDRDLSSLIFNGLLKINSEGVLEPDLADNFQISPDRLVYTFKIKEGVTWHDGKPFSIDDIIFTVNAIQDPEWQSQLKSALGNVQVEKLDETSLRFILKDPVTNFLNSLTFGILPEHKWLSIPSSNATLAELNKKPVGTGAFKFKSLTKDKNGNIRTYTLERNEEYFRQPPYLKELNFKFYGDFESATDALANKNIQGLGLLPKEYQEKVEKNKNIRYYSLSLPQYTAIFFNTKRNDALGNTSLRQALAYAIDRQLILQDSLDQKGVIINGPILPGFIGYHPDIKKYTYDLDNASKLLTEAGWKEETDANGNKIRKKGDEILNITLTTVEKVEYTKAVEIIKQNWQAIGVTTNIEIIGKDRIKSDIIEPRNYDALLFGEIIKSDPYPFWHSSQIESPGANLAIWANKDVNKVLEEARSLEDPEQVNKKYIHFQNIISQYVPAIFLYNPTHTYPTDIDLKGITATRISVPADRFNRISDWYIKTKRKFSWSIKE
ncbi:peptide ABC transporter substrate-binding protein [bacterium]|nr:peptide ABC transporter substrate-binding protein [bacterium]MBT4335407.1 peptide ABC transporter substrate-binding protein [bacterium]MBT4495674.1 peptide ABC transporter substrate-binding protein [bacterium]MBT4763805.1 peptide ABC transporter substrate-binding protein [bacterium]MBT5401175.1 peptide ABC transporter substrate-binding protein [bacterium]